MDEESTGGNRNLAARDGSLELKSFLRKRTVSEALVLVERTYNQEVYRCKPAVIGGRTYLPYFSFEHYHKKVA